MDADKLLRQILGDDLQTGSLRLLLIVLAISVVGGALAFIF